MIKLSMTVPREVTVACSGGVDSMAVVDFLSRRKGSTVKVAYMHHGTEHGEEAYNFLKGYCADKKLELVVGQLTCDRNPKESQEEHWRNQRYLFLHGLEAPVVMAHHLDDNVETWLFKCFNGKPSVIPTRNRNVFRPFMLTSKNQFIDWCTRHQVPYVSDNSNNDNVHARNRIRNVIIPEVLKINPGIQKVVAKIVKEQYEVAETPPSSVGRAVP